jgi:hypothetical protein
MAKKTLQLDTDTGNIEATSASSGGPTAITIDGKTGAYTVVAGDLGKVINCTANTFTVSLTAAATLGAGFWCWVWNTSDTSTHVITIDPNASETIDGATTLLLRRGEGMQIICNGTNWHTGDKKTMRGYAENITSTTARPVVTGDGSVAIGQSYASGTDSFAAAIGSNGSGSGSKSNNCISMGQYATASNSYANAIGFYATASGSSSTAIGQETTSSGNNSAAIGYVCTASGTGSVAIGSTNSASGLYSLSTGVQSISAIYGKSARASGRFSANGDAQTGQFTLRRATTNDTATVLTADNAAASTTNQVILPNDSTYAFTALVVARRTDANDESAGYEFKGVVDRNTTAATTALVGTVTKTVLAEDTTAWDCNVTADATNGGLAFTVTGEANKTIRWVATVWTTEVTG